MSPAWTDKNINNHNTDSEAQQRNNFSWFCPEGCHREKKKKGMDSIHFTIQIM